MRGVISVAHVAIASGSARARRPGPTPPSARWFAVEDTRYRRPGRAAAGVRPRPGSFADAGGERVRAKLEYTSLALDLHRRTVQPRRGVPDSRADLGMEPHRQNLIRKILGTPGFVVATGQTGSEAATERGGRRPTCTAAGRR